MERQKLIDHCDAILDNLPDYYKKTLPVWEGVKFKSNKEAVEWLDNRISINQAISTPPPIQAPPR